MPPALGEMQSALWSVCRLSPNNPKINPKPKTSFIFARSLITMKPYKVLLFLLSVIALLGLLMVAFPKDGIRVNDSLTLRFISPADFFSKGVEYKDVSFAKNIQRDSLFLRDSLSLADSLKIFSSNPDDSSRIQYPSHDKKILAPFFAQLDSLKDTTNKKSIRVIHYGDSQIEGDRISGYLRDRLQELFGGSGAGLVPAVQPIAARSVMQSASENWVRHAVFGMIEQKADHNRYGAMLSVCSYSGNSATLRFSKSNIGYPRNKDITKITIYYGQSKSDVSVTLTSGDINKTVTLPASDKINSVTISGSLNSVFNLSFSGASPEIYGIALDGKKGITVDNIPMRGSSGTRFTRVESASMKNMFKLLNTKLILMEFGGNMMPSVQGPKSIDKYKEEFAAQLDYVKKANPDACVITIGPADMSKRVNGSMQTYPYLEEVRDALKAASFENGCAYWDMYSAMGGKNSMPSWVKEGLAGPDYIHFTPNGAEKIAEIFTQALVDDYNEYRFKMQMEDLRGKETAQP